MPDEAAQSARKYDAVIFDLYGTLIDLPGTLEQERARILWESKSTGFKRHGDEPDCSDIGAYRLWKSHRGYG